MIFFLLKSKTLKGWKTKPKFQWFFTTIFILQSACLPQFITIQNSENNSPLFSPLIVAALSKVVFSRIKSFEVLNINEGKKLHFVTRYISLPRGQSFDKVSTSGERLLSFSLFQLYWGYTKGKLREEIPSPKKILFFLIVKINAWCELQNQGPFSSWPF